MLRHKLKYAGSYKDLQIIFFLLVHDPWFALGLWVNEQWIPGSFGYDDTILYGELITGQALQVPLTDLKMRGIPYYLLSILLITLQQMTD